METWMLVVAVVGLAYALGGVPFGYLVARWRGVDIFQHGSGNIGATNVGRILGRPYGVLVFVLDFAKGALPVALAQVAAQQFQPTASAYLGVVAGLAAFLGHLYSPWLGFRGGKGVATAAGVLVVLMPLAALGAMGLWLVLLAAFRFVSAASVAAALGLCVCHLAITAEPFGSAALAKTLFCGIAAALVVYRHRENLGRLVKGTENRLRETTAMQLLAKTLHVLVLGLWFGSAVFFTFVVGPMLFSSFESLAEGRQWFLFGDQEARPVWFPVSPLFQAEPGALKEQGSRAAGFAISPMFPIYYLLQGVCGFIAVLTALAWTGMEGGRRVHSIRVWVLGLALGTVLIGWPLAQHVSELRDVRNQTRNEHLKLLMKAQAPLAPVDTTSEVSKAESRMADARKDFGMWHGISFLVNMVTLLLVTVAMALAAQLPANVVAPPIPKPTEQGIKVLS